MTANSENSKIERSDGLKKLYVRPQVVVYGTIHEITQAIGHTSSHLDGGGGGMTKTH
jgi:hypothetical protein